MNSAFLCRRTNENQVEDQLCIDVSSLNFEWVETIKEALANERSQGHNIWLTALTQEKSGVIG